MQLLNSWCRSWSSCSHNSIWLQQLELNITVGDKCMKEGIVSIYSFTTKKFKSAGLKMFWNKHVTCTYVCWTLLSLIHTAIHYDIIPGVRTSPAGQDRGQGHIPTISSRTGQEPELQAPQQHPPIAPQGMSEFLIRRNWLMVPGWTVKLQVVSKTVRRGQIGSGWQAAEQRECSGWHW